MQRRGNALAPANAAFEAAVPDRIRGDERFQQALETAETAESVERAMISHEAEVKDWAATGVALLRAIESADRVYERELREALDAYRHSFADREENDANGMQTQ